MSLLQIRKNHQLLFVLAAIFAVVSFFLAFFHTHEDGEHTSDCPVCRLVHQITLVFIAVALFFFVLRRQVFYAEPYKELVSHLSTLSLRDRAPPLLAH